MSTNFYIILAKKHLFSDFSTSRKSRLMFSQRHLCMASNAEGQMRVCTALKDLDLLLLLLLLLPVV
jgi:hypothetical protein